MKLWMICWRFPIVIEVIVGTEFEELLRQGIDGFLMPMQNSHVLESVTKIPPERVKYLVEWPLSRLEQFRWILRVARQRPWGFLKCMRRVMTLVGHDARGACVSTLCVLKKVQFDASPDHIHAHFGGHLTHVASLLALYYGCSWSVSVHAKDIYQTPQNLCVDFQGVAFVRTISEHGHEWVRRYCPNLTVDQLPVIRVSVDTEKIQPRYRSDHQQLRLLSIGRLVPKKGHDLLIRACAQLRERGHQFSCTIIGEGPEHQKLDALVHALNLSAQVYLMGATVRDRVLDEIAQSDIVVLACRQAADGDQDGTPLVLVEAMAMGKPVIAGRAGGVAEVVTQGGVLIEPDDLDGLVIALERFLSMSAEERCQIGMAGRALVEESFCLQKNTAKLATRFRQISDHSTRSTNLNWA
jgi:glycosyltransferase involved in cell wall biosynthesis